MTRKVTPKTTTQKSAKKPEKKAAAHETAAVTTRVVTILERLRLENPDPRCELYYRTSYQLLISVVLSAQATDKSVNRCMQPLYDQGLSPEQVLAMGEQNFLAKIRSIGLAPTKAKNILALTKIILTQHQGRIPDQRDELEALPGVGHKTASVVLGELYRQPTIAVDTHVFRVTTRLGIQQTTSPQKCERRLLEVIPAAYLPTAHHWFILHGRYTCKAVKPLCQNCVLRDLCPSAEKIAN